jgi:hypothetical protein
MRSSKFLASTVEQITVKVVAGMSRALSIEL